MPVSPVREGSLVVVSDGASAPDRCRGQRGIVTLINKFGYCMVYFANLGETYFFAPRYLVLDDGSS